MLRLPRQDNFKFIRCDLHGVIIIITYIYNALSDALSAYRIHNKLKTILSKYIPIQNRQYWFRATVGVRQGYLLSPTLFNIFLEKNMTAALEDHEGTVSIGGRTINHLCFADDIDGLAGEEEELANLVEHLDKASTAYGMEISAEKTKLMSNNTSSINTEIHVNGQKLETVTSFKHLGSVITDAGSKPEILSRIAHTTATLTRLKPV